MMFSSTGFPVRLFTGSVHRLSSSPAQFTGSPVHRFTGFSYQFTRTPKRTTRGATIAWI